MRRACAWLIACATWGVECPAQEPATPPRSAGVTYAPGDEELIRTLGEGYLSNREAFTWFKCRFRLFEGYAPSVDDALAGSTSDVVESEGIWVVDGNRFRFELQCDPELVEEALRNGERIPMFHPGAGPGAGSNNAQATAFAVQLPCDGHGFVTEGEIDFRYDDALRTVNVSRRARLPLPGVTMTPFTLGVMGEYETHGPGRLLTEGGAEGYEHAWIEGSEETAQGEVMIVGMGSAAQEAGKVRRRMYLNPSRGCLPDRVFTYWLDSEHAQEFGPRVSALHFTDIREVSEGRWFPWRGVLVRDPDSSRPRLPVKIIEVVALDLETRPTEADFVMHLPAGTSIVDPTDLRSGFKLAHGRGIGPADLSSVLDETAEALAERLRGSSVLAESPKPMRRHVWLIVVNACALAVILAATWRRQRAQRSA